MMTHAMIESRLDDFVDGLLSDVERRTVERHLEACEACRAEVDGILRLQTAVGALPREMAPPRDLWAGIAARIEQEPREEPAHAEYAEEPADEPVRVYRIDTARRARRGWWMGPRVLAAAAAVVLVVLSSSITALLMRGGAAAPDGPLASAPSESGGAPPTSALVAWEPAERVVLETVEQLEFALEAQRDRLNPETVRVVEENLRIIDRAIAEARAALEADPNNRDLTFLLMDVYKTKVDLLQNTVQISSL
jgi:anti-sigma factor RsiW